MSEIELAIIALGFALALIMAGELLGAHAPIMRRVSMPGAVLGGGIGLILGPQLTGWIGGQELGEQIYSQFTNFPALFINGVFACLMLGKRIEGISALWQRARPQIVMGHVYAWGQYVVGICAFLFIISPLFGINELSAASIAIGFQGGHGTSAGLAESFTKLGFAEGTTIAFAVATFGILAGAVGGPLLATALKKRYPIEEKSTPASDHKTMEEAEDEEPPSFSPLTGGLSLHLALVGTIVALAWALLKAAQMIEVMLRGDISDGASTFTAYIPLFSVVLLVGMSAQFIMQSFGWDRFFRREQFKSISAFSLDLVILGALATLSLSTVGEHMWVILILCGAGIAWNLAVFFILGPRVYPKPWHSYGMGDLGGGTATTASGLLLIRVVDPHQRTSALRAYSEKQPFYEPLMGGGLVTASALPIIASLGSWACLGITASVLTIWLIFALRISSTTKS